MVVRISTSLKTYCRDIGIALSTKKDYHVVVVRSTVIPGTIQEKLIPILERYSGLRAGIEFGVCMNPEFMRESSAIEDFYYPGFIVIGELDQPSGDTVEHLYSRVEAPIFRTTIPIAEMSKYAE